MAKRVQKMTYPCPGVDLHIGKDSKCEFCGSEKGNPQFVNDMPEITREGLRIVKHCCRACENNHNRMADKQYVETSIS